MTIKKRINLSDKLKGIQSKENRDYMIRQHKNIMAAEIGDCIVDKYCKFFTNGDIGVEIYVGGLND